MIKTSRQLKDKIRNYSGGDGKKVQIYIRNYMMERFLERVSVSDYNDNFILKRGMLVASLIGIDMRSTMDIDTTIMAIDLNIEKATKVINDIIAIDIDDGIIFFLKSASEIMEEHDYPGIRFMLEARLDSLRQPVKIDISTGDIITPSAVSYSYKLMMEERIIPIYTYNIETLLAEKLETIIARGTANTRMRDFYDIYLISEYQKYNINMKDLKEAFTATSKKRGSFGLVDGLNSLINDIENSTYLIEMWNIYKKKNYFVGELDWNEIMNLINNLFNKMLITSE